jgi:hypothetical protein
MNTLHTEFTTKLTRLFGQFDASHNRFEQASNGVIARELGYSDAQFSRLVNNSATEGEYQRAIKNIDRILRVQELERELDKPATRSGFNNIKPFAISGLILLFLGGIIWGVSSNGVNSEAPPMQTPDRTHTLKWAFESSFINPYVKLNDLPADCNYPCYKYQGKWNLDKSYKLPFFRERNGFHYLADSVVMYARCMVEQSSSGKWVEGYEYQHHEIWYDMREWPLDSFITNNTLRKRYEELDLSEDENFIKVASVHTFFRNEFNLTDSTIVRSGKVVGRDLEFVSEKELKNYISDPQLLQGIRQELNQIINNRLKDFSRPVKCRPAKLIHPDFNQVKDGDTMGFSCQFTTSRFTVDYEKTFVLTDQYIKNQCVSRQ